MYTNVYTYRIHRKMVGDRRAIRQRHIHTHTQTHSQTRIYIYRTHRDIAGGRWAICQRRQYTWWKSGESDGARATLRTCPTATPPPIPHYEVNGAQTPARWTGSPMYICINDMPNGDANTDSLLRGKWPANTRTINSEPYDKIGYDIWKHLHAHIFLQGGEDS